jgi:cold shock CspA family protein
MRQQGTVVRAHETFGFIQSDQGQKLYWHLSDVKDSAVLHEFDRVSFDCIPNPKGNSCRLKAVGIIPIRASAEQSTTSQNPH